MDSYGHPSNAPASISYMACRQTRNTAPGMSVGVMRYLGSMCEKRVKVGATSRFGRQIGGTDQ